MEPAQDTGAEEVIESIDLEAIAEKYETKGYFRRLGDMFRGLGRPRSSAEYKLARIELQRQTAPLSAMLFILILGVVMTVMTLSDDSNRLPPPVEIPEVQEPEKQEEMEEEPPPPDDIEPPPMEEVEIQVDNPTPGPVTDVAPVPSPPSNQVSVRPAPQDAVSFVNSPVKMKCMTGSRTPGAIGAALRGGAGYGDATTEACVMKVLWWLKAHQKTDGSWDGGNKLANTALATLTYLAHGAGEPQLSADQLCNSRWLLSLAGSQYPPLPNRHKTLNFRVTGTIMEGKRKASHTDWLLMGSQAMGAPVSFARLCI